MVSFQRNLRSKRPKGVPLSALQTVRQQRITLILASLTLAIGLWSIFVIQTPANPGLTPGKPSPISIQASKTTSYTSEWRTNLERERAERASDTVVYTRDLAILTRQRLLLSDFLQTITLIRDDPTLRVAQERERLAALPNNTLVISPEIALHISRLSDARWADVRRYSLDLYDRAVGEYRFALDDTAVAQVRTFSLPYWASLTSAEVEDRELMILFAGAYLSSNQVIDEQATLNRKQQARNSVEPVIVQILVGESIVRVGDVVTDDIEEKLQALGELNTATNWLAVGGKALLAGLLGLIFGSYVALNQAKLRHGRRSIFTILGMCLLMALLARLVVSLGGVWMYAFPLGVIALLIATIFSSGLSLFITGLLVVPIAFLAGGQLDIGVALLVGAISGIFSVGRGERSLRFVLAGLAVGAATAVTALAFAFAEGRNTTPEALATLALLGMLNGVITAVVALGLYNVVGHVAAIVTPLQLMELAHPAQPLLRKLIREAPGTYYHSVAVGNLAESAAEAIGADALLLRVASYYHDIGKTARPFFFTDNQSDRENVHNDLDPVTSAGIIADHVAEGVRLAQAARLPQEIIGFIATHHGTSVIKHFYQQALQLHDSVNINDFRYPGPRPQTREQAVMMLADTIEATVRSKAQHGKIVSGRDQTEELVGAIIEERVRSGQLDESPLTLEDIARIRHAFLTTLQGIYHPRVDYAPQMVKT
jgi:putative nucleotidyltransferase with HDIG domain